MNEFLLVRGIDVPNLTDIHECYEINQRDESFIFIINVSADNIESLITHFCSELVEPCFLIIETPTSRHCQAPDDQARSPTQSAASPPGS